MGYNCKLNFGQDNTSNDTDQKMSENRWLFWQEGRPLSSWHLSTLVTWRNRLDEGCNSKADGSQLG